VSVIFTSQTVPIVIISAKASGKDIAIVEELGVNDYIVKPFSIREVVGRVSSLLKML
jgi:DNA-binding response OmpR family regulator